MIVRIDTTNITRGREFTLYAHNPQNRPVTMRGLDVSNGEVTDIAYSHQSLGAFDGYAALAPSIDGYLLASVSAQKVVKKIGNPPPAFVIGYKPNYTVTYQAYDGSGNEIESGNLTHVGDGFYYTLIPHETAVVKALNRNFIVNKNLLKMNYEVTIEGGTLGSDYENVALENVDLPDVALPYNALGDVTLDSALPDVTIKEL